MLLQSVGCTRPFYRKRADEEVSEVLAQKDKYPDWKIDQWHVYADPRARFADSSDPDHPPMPPDDPAAFCMSPNPQKPGKAGVARIEGTGYLELIAQWDKENRERRTREEAAERRELMGRDDVPVPPQAKNEPTGKEPAILLTALQESDPPAGKPPYSANDQASPNAPGPKDAISQAKERSLLDVSDRPTFLLSLDQAAELAMFNSREYQDQRENLYIAALPVTVQRFAFSTQLFAAGEAIRGYSGSQTPGGPSNNWTINNGVGASKVLPTGALLLLNFSNQTVFEFLNPKHTVSNSTLSFNAIQPLLRGGGRAVALEGLTQAERTLLYAIRNFARFRKELYVEIASNNGGSINGGAFQPSGVLSNGGGSSSGLGNSGVTPGVIPQAGFTLNGPTVAPSTPGSLALSAALTPPPSGYLQTMLQKIQVYIDQENIDTLIGILRRYQGLLEGDVVGPLQVQNVEQQLLAGRATLLVDQQDYSQSLNSFKIEIGVPMQLNIETDDSVLRPLLKQFRRSRAIIENEQAAVSTASNLIEPDMAPRMRQELLKLYETSTLVRGTPFANTIRSRWGELQRLSSSELNSRLEALRTESQALLDRQAELQRKGLTLSRAEVVRLKNVNTQRDLGNFERAVRQYEADYVEMGKPTKSNVAGDRQRIRKFQSVLSSWQKVLVEARDNKWEELRASWPELPRCCVDGVDLVQSELTIAQTTAARHALENRLDLMNVRGQVTDSWRQLAVYANALLGTFTVQYQVNASSPAGAAQPLNVGGSGTTNQLILNTQLPLVRVTERNNYRASQIAYQRQRRALQEAEDLAVQVVYNEMNLLRQYAEAYKVQKRLLELAYLTIDSSLESLQAPTAAGGTGRAGSDGPAALTQQLLTAQRSLPTAQNGLLTVWINYMDARLSLYRDLELMPLDARGVWIDEIRDCDCGLGAPSGVPVQPSACVTIGAEVEVAAASALVAADSAASKPPGRLARPIPLPLISGKRTQPHQPLPNIGAPLAPVAVKPSADPAASSGWRASHTASPTAPGRQLGIQQTDWDEADSVDWPKSTRSKSDNQVKRPGTLDGGDGNGW